MTIQSKAIEKAIDFLTAAKADFCVKYEGVIYGNLKPQSEVIKKRRPNKYSHHELYRDAINTMQIGDVKAWTFDRDRAESFRSSLTSAASQAWGNDSYMTTVQKTTVGMCVVEIMRIK